VFSQVFPGSNRKPAINKNIFFLPAPVSPSRTYFQSSTPLMHIRVNKRALRPTHQAIRRIAGRARPQEPISQRQHAYVKEIHPYSWTSGLDSLCSDIYIAIEPSSLWRFLGSIVHEIALCFLEFGARESIEKKVKKQSYPLYILLLSNFNITQKILCLNPQIGRFKLKLLIT
jgi:hypothetical protein